jgi:hypothetical protein
MGRHREENVGVIAMIAILFLFIYITTLIVSNHVRWAPCHHGMASPQVADGGDGLQIWRVAANILKNRSRTADKGWSSSLGVWRGANHSLKDI